MIGQQSHKLGEIFRRYLSQIWLIAIGEYYWSKMYITYDLHWIMVFLLPFGLKSSLTVVNLLSPIISRQIRSQVAWV